MKGLPGKILNPRCPLVQASKEKARPLWTDRASITLDAGDTGTCTNGIAPTAGAFISNTLKLGRFHHPQIPRTLVCERIEGGFKVLDDTGQALA